MENKKLLIVEDNVSEAILAQGDAIQAGVTDLVVATNLSDALSYLPKAGMVVTDLFFPAGSAQTDQYIQRFLPMYESFKASRFKKIDTDNIVYRAVEQVAKLFDVTPQKYVEEIMTLMKTPKSIQNAARDALAGVEDSEKYVEFQKIEEDIRSGRKLPLGIIVAEQAIERGLPSVIVTSTYHHSNEFEPIRNIVPVRYFDTLIEGRKNWQEGIEALLGGKN